MDCQYLQLLCLDQFIGKDHAKRQHMSVVSPHNAVRICQCLAFLSIVASYHIRPEVLELESRYQRHGEEESFAAVDSVIATPTKQL